MDEVTIELPARRTAWLADHAYQIRLTEHARTVAAAAGNVLPNGVWLAAASMPDTYENAQLADRDEVRVRFTFRALEALTHPVAPRGRRRRAA